MFDKEQSMTTFLLVCFWQQWGKFLCNNFQLSWSEHKFMSSFTLKQKYTLIVAFELKNHFNEITVSRTRKHSSRRLPDRRSSLHSGGVSRAFPPGFPNLGYTIRQISYPSDTLPLDTLPTILRPPNPPIPYHQEGKSGQRYPTFQKEPDALSPPWTLWHNDIHFVGGW